MSKKMVSNEGKEQTKFLNMKSFQKYICKKIPKSGFCINKHSNQNVSQTFPLSVSGSISSVC